MDIKPIIKEENIVERQDVEKIEEINSIIAEIQKKLNSKDYKTAVLSQYVKPIQYIWVSLPELNIYLTPIRSGVEGHFGRNDYNDFKAPYILLHNTKFKSVLGNRIEFDENGMAHELQHFLDWKAGNKFTDFKNILKPEGGINPEYYNDPTEWSAYVIQLLRQYFQKVPLKKLAQDFQSFYKDFWRKTEAKEYYKTLTPENKKKFHKYLWQFHQKLLERKNSVNNIIGEEIQNVIQEEFTGDSLYGYHCTPCNNIENIAQNGLQIGGREMQGKGIYAFFNIKDNSSGNAAFGYGIRNVSSRGFCIVKFKFNSFKRVLVFNKARAIEIFGEQEADIIKQFDRAYFGFDNFLEKYIYPHKHLVTWIDEKFGGIEGMKEYMRGKFNNGGEDGQKTILFNMFPADFLERYPDGIVFDGEYGETIIASRPQAITVLGYYEVYREEKTGNYKLSEFRKFNTQFDNIIQKINSDEKYEPLRELLPQLNSIEDLSELKSRYEEKRSTVRNNRDYDYYTKTIDLLDELIDPRLVRETIEEEVSEFNKTKFSDVPDEIFQKLRLRKFSDEANRSHMKIFKAKDGKDYIVKKEINQDVFHIYRLDNLNFPVATAVFDVQNDFFSGYETSQSIKVEPQFRRLGMATALTDFAENIYNLPYKPTKLLSEPMQGFVDNRFGVNEETNKKIYYHGRKMGGRPYSGMYIFITDNLGYASGYSDGKKLYTYSMPFSTDKLFSIKNPKHVDMLRKYLDDQSIQAIFRDSGSNNEMDWTALQYIGTDEYEESTDLLMHLGFYGVYLQERQGIDSIYIFDESKLKAEGEIDITTPEMIDKIGKFYQDFTKDKNFLEERDEASGPASEGIADKYAEKTFGIKDPNREMDAMAINAIPKEENNPMGELIGNVKLGKRVESQIYANPKSLENFEVGVRALSDIDGNLFVAQRDGDFVHYEFGRGINAGGKYDIGDAYNDTINILWMRIKNSNTFGFSDSMNTYISKETNYYKVKERTAELQAKHPEFKFIPEIFWDVNKKEVIEGVADKYAEKEFNIQDPNVERERQAISAIPPVEDNDPKGDYAGYIGINEQMIISPIYENPKSLSEFDKDVRAISNKAGQLFVALFDESFNHGTMGKYVDKFGKYHIGKTYDDNENITWHRVGATNVFGFSDSFNPHGQKDLKNRLILLNELHPQFEFVPELYWYYNPDKEKH